MVWDTLTESREFVQHHNDLAISVIDLFLWRIVNGSRARILEVPLASSASALEVNLWLSCNS